ncbi:MAG TPA: zf-HC2 domain-containing protein [Armatimonadota bacterium]|nr:zf-HC2 domain-containing protein [Armatimonadota bacterium]
MKCRKITRMLGEYVEGDLPAHRRAEVAAHLHTCGRCRAEAAAWEQAQAALCALSAIEAAPERAVLMPAGAPTRAGWGFRRTWVGAGLAVAAVVLAVWLWTRTDAGPPRSGPSPQRIAARAHPAPLKPSPTGVIREAAPQRAPGPSPARRVAHRPYAPRPSARMTPSAPPALGAQEVPPALPEVVEPPAPAPPADAAEPESLVAAAPSPAIGLILLLGPPPEWAPLSSCQVEVSFPDRAKSVVEQVVERNPDGSPRAIRIACDNAGPEPQSRSQGG